MFQIFVFVIICLKVLDILKSFSSVFLAADKDSDAKYLLGGSIYNDSKGVKKTCTSLTGVKTVLSQKSGLRIIILESFI